MKPQWTIEPEDVTSSLSKEINLECDAKAYPTATIQWTKLDENSKLMIRMQSKINTKSYFHFIGQTVVKEFRSNRINFELTKESSGSYKCKATNSIGSIEKIINVGYFGK